MSLNGIDILIALRTRLIASGGSDVSGVFVMNAPPGTTPTDGGKPYLIVTSSSEQLDSFTHNGLTRQVVVRVIDHVNNDIAQLGAAWDAIYGDGDPGGDTPPTVGLHRHRLTLVGSSNEVGVLVFEGDNPVYDGDLNARGIDLRFTLTVEGVAPEE
jgi:hypothetical protein